LSSREFSNKQSHVIEGSQAHADGQDEIDSELSATRWEVIRHVQQKEVLESQVPLESELKRENLKLQHQLLVIQESRAWRLISLFQRAVGRLKRLRRKLRKKRPSENRFPLDKELIEIFFDPLAYSENSESEETTRSALIDHYLRTGFFAKLDPCLGFDNAFYLESNVDVALAQINPLDHFVKYGFQEGRLPSARASVYPPARRQSAVDNPITESSKVESMKNACLYLKDLSDLLQDYLIIDSLDEDGKDGPVRTPQTIAGESLGYSRKWFRTSPTANPQVNIVTDSIADHSLFGGVATALILGNFLSLELGFGLRVLTNDQSSRALVRRLFKSNGITLNPHFEVSQLRGLGQDVETISDRDVFVATSWWSAASLVPSPNENQIIYLIQEDERSFYPTGDQYLLAHRMMNNPAFIRVVNSSNLYTHLQKTGISFSSSDSIHFEPSFSTSRRFRKDSLASTEASEEFKLLFYGRPNHQRNLYYTGLQAIDKFLMQGRDSPVKISVTCTGDPIVPNPQFATGTRMNFLGALSWDGYMKRLADFDLVLSLMASPHTSYPPLDALSVGCKVVSNTWPGKPDASDLGSGIYLASPYADDIAFELSRAVEDIRLERFSGATALTDTHPKYRRDWREQLDLTLTFLCSSVRQRNV
jgi:hypothetical protein